ncbi:MAG: DUF1538 family protein [Bacilli bacterium]|nr:DUF1538 family protein [Bacilli bacterium]
MYKFLITLKKIGFLYIPVTILVIILSLLFKIDILLVLKFIFSSILIIFGVSFYLIGYDLSYLKISDKICNNLLKKKNIYYMLGISFLISFFLIIFEPEILKVSYSNISLLIILSLSISFFFILSLIRILSKSNYKYYLIISYIIVFLLMNLTDKEIIPFVLERSTLMLGLVSAPFLLTMGLSLSKRKKNKNSNQTSFGILGLSSIGPMIVFLIIGMFYKIDTNNIQNINFIYSLLYILISLVILFIVYLVFLRFNIKRNKKQILIVIKGLILVFLGISLFLVGANNYYEFASILGSKLSSYHTIQIAIVMFIFSFFIIRVEPSFNFLMNYVVDVTSGGIKDKFLELFLGIGASLALIISVYIVKNNLEIMEFLIPSFFLAILLSFFTPNKFLGIAFDSLGAIIGTISSTFFIPFLLGLNSSANTIGLLAFIGIVPVIFLELAGFIYEKEVILHDYNSLDEGIVDYD